MCEISTKKFPSLPYTDSIFLSSKPNLLSLPSPSSQNPNLSLSAAPRRLSLWSASSQSSPSLCVIFYPCLYGSLSRAPPQFLPRPQHLLSRTSSVSFLPPCSSSTSFSSQLPNAENQAETLTSTLDRWDILRSPIKAGSSVVLKRDRSGDTRNTEKSLEEHVADWREKEVKSGVPEIECDLPFLTNAPRMFNSLKKLCECNRGEALHLHEYS